MELTIEGRLWGTADPPVGNNTRFCSAAGTVTDLNTLVTIPTGVFLNAANGINDLGQIVAYGSDGHAYLLTPSTQPPLASQTITFGALSNVVFGAGPFSISATASYINGGVFVPEPTATALGASGLLLFVDMLAWVRIGKRPGVKA